LFVRGRLQPGETVVVQGTGGVSIFALQLARAAGARVIVTSSSDEKIARALALGASEGINYRSTPDWHAQVLRLTDGRGADHVVDVVGGKNLARSIAASKIGGAVSLVGYLDGFHADIDLPLVLRRVVTLHGMSVGSRQSFEALVAACEANAVRPVIDRVFPFDEARGALEYLARGHHFGKVAISFG
jgi:NADPH:quinone reductase-like Zn-dependent oxidoreductase